MALIPCDNCDTYPLNSCPRVRGVASIKWVRPIFTTCIKALLLAASVSRSFSRPGKVLCTSGACNAIWAPLTVTTKGGLTAPPPLAKKLGTVSRPDGSMQVTLNGQPLYTFSFDHSAGEVNGDGTQDSFDGTNFTWHVATPSGQVAPSSPSSSASPYTKGYGY